MVLRNNIDNIFSDWFSISMLTSLELSMESRLNSNSPMCLPLKGWVWRSAPLHKAYIITFLHFCTWLIWSSYSMKYLLLEYIWHQIFFICTIIAQWFLLCSFEFMTAKITDEKEKTSVFIKVSTCNNKYMYILIGKGPWL